MEVRAIQRRRKKNQLEPSMMTTSIDTLAVVLQTAIRLTLVIIIIYSIANKSAK